MKTYRGWRHDHLATVLVDGGRGLPLRTDLFDYAIEFDWRAASPGASQLALALLADAVDAELAVAFHQEFKASVVANLPRYQRWQLTEEQLKDWVAGLDDPEWLRHETKKLCG